MEWWKQVWKSEGPFKEKITLWLALNNKLLTWENIKKRGLEWSNLVCIMSLK